LLVRRPRVLRRGLGQRRAAGRRGSRREAGWLIANEQQTARENAEVVDRKQQDAICGGYREAKKHPDRTSPEQMAVLATLCEDDATAAQQGVLRAMDRGLSSPIFLATLVAFCGDTPAYYAWRECREWADQVDPKALGVAIDQATSDAYVRDRSRAIYQRYREKLAAAEPAMADLVADNPGLALLYDDARRDVRQDFEPRFRRWQHDLVTVDDWLDKIHRGPRFAGTCRPDLTAMLQTYVQSAVPTPDKDRLLAALRDPIGYPIAAALAVCLKNLDDQEAFDKIAFFIAGARRGAGPHYALVTRLLELQRASGKAYKGKRLISSRVYGEYDVRWVDRLIEPPWVNE
jgi:hypothetical protein